ncbi:MAG TPA: hypothetical protein VLK85_34115 [Ramlibacter sp.]|nr:hypothetical protein [Ramlibacter sp.]
MNWKIVLAALAAAAGSAGAQPVYRCGNSYGQQPCTGATALPASVTPSAADAAQARAVAQADARRADAMEKARMAQERQAPKALVIGSLQGAASTPAGQAAARPVKGGKLEQFTAVAPGTVKAKVKKKRS